MTNTFAAIDCGTNAIRLLIARVDRGAQGVVVTDIRREMRTVRLGEGVDATGEFSAAALERTFAAAREYRNFLSQHDVTALRFIATSASRDVSNRSEFIRGIESILGIEPEVISGEEEAALSYGGAINGFNGSGQLLARPILVADIGGGSSEFVMQSQAGDLISHSLNIGCVRMTERHLASDPPTDPEIQAARTDIERQLTAIRPYFPEVSSGDFIGLAGSVTTVAAMALGLSTYDAEAIHGARLTRDQVESVCDQFISMTRAQRADLGFMHPGRIDVIGGGALVLRETMRVLELNSVIASEKDILDGIVVALAST